jgi:hypothetical protein
LQKDGSKEWKVRGFISRLAKPYSVITNLKFTEKILLGEEALKVLYGFNPKAVNLITRKIEESSILVGKSLDKNLGHFGDIALDFILDSNGNVYFLEGNANYGQASFRKIKDYELRNSVFKSPMEYAKALSGFSAKSQ